MIRAITYNGTALLATGGLMFVLMSFVGFVADFDSFSDGLIVKSLQKSPTKSLTSDSDRSALVMMNDAGQPYLSHFGLQYKAYHLVMRLLPFEVRTTVRLLEVMLALLTTAVLMLFVTVARRDLGSFAAWTTWIQLMASYPLVVFASDLYWVSFLHFLPVVAVFLIYGRPQLRGKMAYTTVAIALLVFLKALCGYEYVSSVLLSCVVPIVLYGIRSGHTIRTIVSRSGLVLIAGATGFALAFATSLYQAAWVLGSSRQGWELIVNRAVERTFQVGTTHREILFTVRTFLAYFTKNGQLWIFASAVIAILFLRGISRSPRRDLRAWTITITVALAASLSWNAVAWGHMRDHPHLNSITFFIPFNLIVFLLNSFVLRTASQAVGDSDLLHAHEKEDLPLR